ncbi:MAG: alanine racemase [Acidobacteriota bacterium]|nr:alanine racemase [Acidobacteriota bacterium]
MKNWVEISANRLAENYAHLSQAAGSDTAVLAVIKANAYGHGAELCAPILAAAGARWLGVTHVAEGEAVLHALASHAHPPRSIPSILIMSGLLPEDAEAIVQRGLVPVVWNLEQMGWLAAAAERLNTSVRIHVEVDTGMARQGVTPGHELSLVLESLKAHTRLQLDGVLTHFASAEVAKSPQTSAQRISFNQAIAQIAAAGFRPAWVHAGNSSTVDTESTEHNLAWLRTLATSVGARPMVRTGLALYGFCLPVETATGAAPGSAVHTRLRPVMSWKTRIIGLREIQSGDPVGYNAIFSAPKRMRLALLPIGYADGLRRELSATNTQAGGWVMIKHQRAPIVGRISMNLTTVDVSDIPDLRLGDEAEVLGDGVTADDHARAARTIPYEILCGVRPCSYVALS